MMVKRNENQMWRIPHDVDLFLPFFEERGVLHVDIFHCDFLLTIFHEALVDDARRSLRDLLEPLYLTFLNTKTVTYQAQPIQN